MENNEAIASGDEGMLTEQAEPVDNISYWNFGYDSEKYILPGKFVDYTDEEDTATITMSNVSVQGPVRDLDVIVVAVRAFITVRALKLGTAKAAVQEEFSVSEALGDTNVGIQQVGNLLHASTNTTKDIPFH